MSPVGATGQQYQALFDKNIPEKKAETDDTEKTPGAGKVLGKDSKSTGVYNDSKKIDDPSGGFDFDKAKTKKTGTGDEINSIHHYSCIEDVIKAATGKEVKLPSGEPLTEKLLKDKTGIKWDAINLGEDQNKAGRDLSKLSASYLSDGQAEDGSLIAKPGVIISDGAHTYMVKDFQYKMDGDKIALVNGKPVITGLLVVDPASGKERTITAEEIKKTKNITAFVTGEGDKSISGKADSRMASSFKDITSHKTLFNPADGKVGSESYNIRLLFIALGDPTQKVSVQKVMNGINNIKIGPDGKADEVQLKKLQELIKKELKTEIPLDELEGIAKLFQTDISSFEGDSGTKDLAGQIKKAKEGKGVFGTYAKNFFNAAGSPKGKVTIGDMFLYMQGEKTFSEAKLPTGVEFKDSQKVLENVDASGQKWKAGSTYLDPEKKVLYKVDKLVTDPPPPKATLTKLDGLGSELHNHYSTGIQFVQLSFENFGTSGEDTSTKAESLMKNFNNLFHGAEGC